jgi:hypothetical protein
MVSQLGFLDVFYTLTVRVMGDLNRAYSSNKWISIVFMFVGPGIWMGFCRIFVLTVG